MIPESKPSRISHRKYPVGVFFVAHLVRIQDRLMLHSYGDTDLVCGLDAKGTGGAWRSPRGMLAITK